MEAPRKTSKQESDRKKPNDNEDSNQNRSHESGEGSGQGSDVSDQMDSFLVDDDFQQDEDDDYDSKSQRKKKKKKEKSSKKQKKKKKKNRRDSDDSVIADDLDVVQEAQGNLLRLKKNKKAYKQNLDDDFAEQEQQYGDMEQQNPYNDDSGFGRNQYQQESQQSQYRGKKYEEADLDDLLDERARKQFFADTTDKQILDMDLPQRQIMKYKTYAKNSDTQIDTIQKEFQQEDRNAQARWIYKRLRGMGFFEFHEQRQCKSKIQNVLLAMHREHLDIMYIYYYRKKIWADALNLQLLTKIQEIDEQWMSFKKEFKTLQDDITAVIPSFQHVPKAIYDSLNDCTDIRQLRLFKDYSLFILSKRKSDIQIKQSNKRQYIIKQICDAGIDTWLSAQQTFLSPINFYQNYKDRIQRRKPFTPNLPPDRVLRKLLNQPKEQQHQNIQKRFYSKKDKQKSDQLQEQQDRKKDWSAFPLLSPQKRITTLIDYLAIELFNYPEIRKSLKQKYYRKLLMTTFPTNKGSQNINIYNSFFPVKRIKDKPINSLKKQLWVLAKEAERQGLITIQLKFEWQLSTSDKKNFEGDPVYDELVKYYFDLSSQQSGESWNLLRKRVLVRMLTDHFLPAFIEQVKEDLTREGTKQIIQACCQKFRIQLNKGPSLKQGNQINRGSATKSGEEPIKILAMVLQQQKLGIAFVDQQGKQHSALSIQLKTDDQLKRFVSDQVLSRLIEENRPDMILVSANCRRAQTLRKQLRNPNLFNESSIYCQFGEYEVPNLMANKNIIQGVSSQKCILEAISMARLKKNPMAEILGLWSDNIDQNGIYSMNLHPMQKYINKKRLIDALEKVAIEMVNLVGVNIDDIRNSDHCRNILQFVSGLGPRKAFDLIQKVKEKYPPTRKHLLQIVKSSYVYTNCSPFIKFQRQQHLQMVDRVRSNFRQQSKKQKHTKHKGKDNDQSQINLLDMTRIPQQWYALTQRLFLQAIKPNLLQLKHKKQSTNLTDQQISVREMFKNPQKLRLVQWQSRKDENKFYDQALVKAEIMNNFKDPRQREKQMQNKTIFYSLLKQSPQTLRKYMIVTVRVLSVNQQFLNVVIQQNGLFGYIKIPNDRNNQKNKPKYQKGMFVKAVITGFPFDERRQRQRQQGDQQQELLKVDMSLNFPHRSDDKNHDCQRLCLPSLLKQIHPNMDLDKQTFDLSKQNMPVIEVKQQAMIRPKAELKRISHPKFKNINMITAVQQVKQLKVGDFLIRPSTQGNNFLTITWHFYKGIVSHIKIKCQQRAQTGALVTYRILDKAKDKVYSSIQEIIQRYLKPMNSLVQDVISNKKFLTMPLQQIQQKVRSETTKQQAYIQYYFGCSPQFPQFFILVYVYRQKKPTKQLIRVKNDGLHFHDQCFSSIRDVIGYFKQHLKDRKYQSYVKSANPFKK